MSEQNRANATGRTLPSREPRAFLIRREVLLAGCMVVLAALAVYRNSFTGPFIFDDVWSIENNPTIHHFGSALSPPSDKGVGGRPILNLTFALNYALGGLNVWGYHAFNLLIHVLAGLVLFGVVRRTLLERPTSNTEHPTSKSNQFPHQIRGTIFRALSPNDALLLALAVAAIWVVHPLQSEAVTYISQRAESLMGLFYLLTLYCFIRSQESGDRSQEAGDRRQEKRSGFRPLASSLWSLASIFACLLGVMSKEVIATAPVMVWLYDRTFVAGSFREAWRLRWRYYLGLAATWLLLAWLMRDISQRSVRFDQGVTSWSYALTSCRSVVLYFKLAFWPHPLVFLHDADIIRHATEAWPYAVILAGLLAGTAIALWRWPAIGFAGAWFFVILGPTSSIIPLTAQPMAEHRMYLSLAGVISLAVLGLYAWVGRRSLMVFAVVALALGWLCIQRNQDYQSRLAIWSDTVEKNPDNAAARYSLGNALAQIPDLRSAAVSEYEAALQIKPEFLEARINMADTLSKIPGRLPEAIAQYETVLRSKPDYLMAYKGLGGIYLGIKGRMTEAVSQFEEAVRLAPDDAEAHCFLGTSLGQSGRIPEAIVQLEEALRINPDYAEAHFNLSIALLQATGRLPEAIAHLKAALRIKPDFKEAQQLLEAIEKTHPNDKGLKASKN